MLTTEVQDAHAWYLATAQALREGRLNEVDLLEVAEELEDMGKNLKRSLESYATNLLLHLLKWRFQPNRRSASWIDSIDESRDQLQQLLKFNPSLHPYYFSTLPECYQKACTRARNQTGLINTFPPINPWSSEQLLDDDLYITEFANFWQQQNDTCP